ncbi:MAG TPA: argininosuccinate lyase [Chloroflexota bacterium]|nr:argininosuccinate lyase [Chloroflexota bacterium]
MRQQPSAEYRGYRTAGIRLAEDLAPELRQGRESAERAALYAFHAFDKAHVAMLTEEGIIPHAVGAAILRAFRDMEQEGVEAVRTRIGGGQHSGEVYLIRRLGEEVGGWEHLGRSSNDLSAVGRRIRERDRLLDTLAALDALRATLLDLARAHLHTVLPAYFHWQHAQPTTLGHYFTAMAQALARDAERGRQAYARVNQSPAGAVILTGTSFPLRRERTAALLGFDGVLVNTLDACQDDDHQLDCFGFLAPLAAHLSRLAEDLSYWSGTELGYVEVADRYASGSSILMQMKTPTPTNRIKGIVSGVVGGMVSAYMAAKTATGMHTLDRAYGDAPLDAAFDDVVGSLRLLAPTLASLTVHAERARQRAADHFAAATDLAGALVAEKGLPWRTAHQICGILFRHCAERGLTPADLTPALLDEAAVEYFGRPVGLGAESIRRALDPKHFVEARTLLGGPAPDEVARQGQALGAALAADQRWLAERRQALAAAAAALEEAIDAILA